MLSSVTITLTPNLLLLVVWKKSPSPSIRNTDFHLSPNAPFLEMNSECQLALIVAVVLMFSKALISQPLVLNLLLLGINAKLYSTICIAHP